MPYLTKCTKCGATEDFWIYENNLLQASIDDKGKLYYGGNSECGGLKKVKCNVCGTEYDVDDFDIEGLN